VINLVIPRRDLMKRYLLISLALALALGAVFVGGGFSQAAAKEPKILEFDSMVGVPSAFTGSQDPIRGINGGGVPWAIGPTFGELMADGKLEISVHGLVFAAGPNVGRNTVPSFRAIVSCLTSDGGVVNLTTAPFPATQGAASEGGGNAEIEAMLVLPQPCMAPIVFVTSPGGAWFATTGK
jgi:hypothetical protein